MNVLEIIGLLTVAGFAFSLGQTLYVAVARRKRASRLRRYLIEYHRDALPEATPQNWPVERFN